MLIILTLILSLVLLYIYLFLKPSNDRIWEVGYQKLPQIKINGDLISVSQVRDFHYDIGKVVSFDYVDRTFDLNKINRVWFVLEPFGAVPGTAHTYFIFDFANQDPVAISVEARREKGERFNVLSGLFNQYELIYVWGTETDETIRRVVMENNKLYMYPLKISDHGAKSLFLQLAEASQNLVTTPRFYNTFTSNCTNELAKSANKVKPNAIPLDIALILPGYSTNLLYKLGYLPHDLTLEELKQKYYISEIVKKIYSQPDFSLKLRSYLK